MLLVRESRADRSGRLIANSLSTRAAEELGMTAQGLARVEIEVLPEQTASSAVE